MTFFIFFTGLSSCSFYESVRVFLSEKEVSRLLLGVSIYKLRLTGLGVSLSPGLELNWAAWEVGVN